MIAYSMFESNGIIIRYMADAASLCYTGVVDGKERERKSENKTVDITSFLTKGLGLSLSCYYLAITWIMVGFL